SWSSIANRLRSTIFDLGTFQSVILLAAPLIMVARIRRMPGAPLVAGWLLLTLVVLATSSNVGTGFGLPLVAVGITLVGALLLGRSQPKAPAATTTLLDRGRVAVTSGLKHRLTAHVRPQRALVLGGGLLVTALVLALLVQAIADNAARTRFDWPLVVIAVFLVGAMTALRPVAAAVVVAVLGLGFAAEWAGRQSESWH